MSLAPSHGGAGALCRPTCRRFGTDSAGSCTADIQCCEGAGSCGPDGFCQRCAPVQLRGRVAGWPATRLHRPPPPPPPPPPIGRFAWTTCAPCERSCCDLGACRVRVGGCACACKGVRECAAPLTVTLLCTHLRVLPLPRGNTFADPLSLGTASCASASGDTTPYFNGVSETLCSPEGSGPNVVSLWQLQAGRQHQRTCCLCAPAHARPRCTLIPDISLDCAF